MLDAEKNELLNSSNKSSDTFSELSKDNPIRPIPFEAIIYNLTQLFHCTPSQLMDEDNNLIMDVLSIHNTYADIDRAQSELEEKNKGTKINRKVFRRMAIALELEKLK